MQEREKPPSTNRITQRAGNTVIRSTMIDLSATGEGPQIDDEVDINKTLKELRQLYKEGPKGKALRGNRRHHST